MALKAYIPYRTSANDASGSILKLHEGIIRKGFLSSWNDTSMPGRRNEVPAPVIEPVSGTLNFRITGGTTIGWVAVAADGMVVRANADDGPWTFTVVAGTKYYFVLKALYVSSPNSEVYSFDARTETAYNSASDKDSLIIVGTVTVPTGLTAGSADHVDYSERHRLEGLYDSSWRPSVPTYSSLSYNSVELKSGDCVVVRDTLGIYIWDGASWVSAGGLAEIQFKAQSSESEREERRALCGSGLIAGSLVGGAYGYDPMLTLHEHTITANKLGVGEIRALVNGHFLKTRNLDVTMSSPPNSGSRYDIVYLEVYLQKVSSPLDINGRCSDGSFLSSAEISAKLESLLARADHSSNSFDIPTVESRPNGYVVSVVSLRTAVGIGEDAVSDIYDFSLYENSPVNSEGSAWNYSPAQYDNRVWTSDHSNSIDGIAYALPLLVVKRTSDENITGDSAGVRIFRNGARYVYPVHPVVNTHPVTSNSARLASVASFPDFHSGLLTDSDVVVVSGLTVRLNDAVALVKGYRCALQNNASITLPDSPSSGGARSFVGLECRFLAHPDADSINGVRVISTGEFRSVSYTPGYQREMFLELRMVAFNGDYEDVPEFMSSRGYSAVSGDLGLWSKVETGDPRNNFENKAYLLPLAIIPRFNSGDFNISTNPNGGAVGTRVDGYAHNSIRWPYPQVSNRTGLSHSEIQARMSSTFQLLTRSQANLLPMRHPTHTGVCGTRYMVADIISPSSVSGFNRLPRAANGKFHCWSEASEVRPFGVTFSPEANFSDGIHTWTAGSPGKLRVTMPSASGMAIYSSDVESSASDCLHLLHGVSTTPNKPYQWDDGDSNTSSPSSVAPSNITVLARDARGYPTSIEMNFATTGTKDLHVWYWVLYDRSPGDTQHSANGGLTATPNRIFKVTHTSSEVQVGAAPMITDITVSGFSGTVLTLSSSQLSASSPYAGNGTFQYSGLIGVSVVGTPSTTYTATLSTSQVVITFSSSLSNKTVHVSVAYKSSVVDKWVEISRAARAVTGMYSFVNKDWTGQTANSRYMSLGTSYAMVMRFVCLMTKQTSDSSWTVVPASKYTVNVFEGTDGALIEGLDSAYLYSNYLYRAVFVQLLPLNDVLRIFYETTPYQGMSRKAGLPTSSVKSMLQGKVLATGKAFVSTFGRIPQYVAPETVANSALVSHAYDYARNNQRQFSSRSKSLMSSGTSLWKLRETGHPSKTVNDHLYSFLNVIIPDYGGMLDQLPWPNWNFSGGLYTAGSDGSVQISEYDLRGGELNITSGATGGFLILDDGAVSEQLDGSSRPECGVVIEYNDLNAYKTAMESASIILGTRGLTVTCYQYDGSTLKRHVSDGVSCLAFGNLEGLLTSEVYSGVCGFVISGEPPEYLHPGIPWRLDYALYGNNGYYGGHYMAIYSEGWTPVMQISGGPKTLAGASPNYPWPLRIGGNFDAYYIMGRPLPRK